MGIWQDKNVKDAQQHISMQGNLVDFLQDFFDLCVQCKLLFADCIISQELGSWVVYIWSSLLQLTVELRDIS